MPNEEVADGRGSWLRSHEFVRFLFVGFANTAITYVIYVVLALVVPYAVAYTITTALGIFISYILNARFVFRRKLSLVAALQYPIVYLTQYVLGLLLLYLLVEKADMSKFLAPIVIVAATVPVTFVLSRFVIGRNRFATRISRGDH
jgi:putative flippase GtrA